MFYYCQTEADDDAIRVFFPDIPEAISLAESEDRIEDTACEALVTALDFYAETGADWPAAKARFGTPVHVPVLDMAKLELRREMARQAVSRSELARRLNVDEKAVRRLLDFNRRSHIAQIDRALQVLGKRLDVRVTA